MRILKRLTLLTLAIGLMASTLANAQSKLGYINSLELLASMPESKSADASLKTYQDQLTAEGQQKLDKLEKDLAALYSKIEKGEITPKDQAAEEAKLKQQETELIQFEQQASEKLLNRREELYSPIFDKANTAIKNVAEENGFTMIFDSSAGILLHAEESDNILALVKQKLSIP